ncbi:MAG: hypothetical protein ACOZNI_17380 [Myxococcota bacterium]
MLLLTLAACPPTTPGKSSCDELPEPPAVAGCFRGGDVEDTGGFAPIAGEWTGTVAEVGSGDFPSECTSDFGANPTASAWWARLTTHDGDFWIGVETPGAVAPTVGAELRVAATYDYGEWSATEGSVAVYAGDTLLAWVGSSSGAESLVPPDGVTFADGTAVCDRDDDCGTVSYRDLDVTADGAVGTVPYGDTFTLGGLTFTNGGLQQVEEDRGECLDWSPSSVLAGISRE